MWRRGVSRSYQTTDYLLRFNYPVYEHPDYADANAIFCKVDVDKAPSVAKANGITSMPSFKIIKDAKEVKVDYICLLFLFLHLPNNAVFMSAPTFIAAHYSSIISDTLLSKWKVSIHILHFWLSLLPFPPLGEWHVRLEWNRINRHAGQTRMYKNVEKKNTCDDKFRNQSRWQKRIKSLLWCQK